MMKKEEFSTPNLACTRVEDCYGCQNSREGRDGWSDERRDHTCDKDKICQRVNKIKNSWLPCDFLPGPELEKRKWAASNPEAARAAEEAITLNEVRKHEPIRCNNDIDCSDCIFTQMGNRMVDSWVNDGFCGYDKTCQRRYRKAGDTRTSSPECDVINTNINRKNQSQQKAEAARAAKVAEEQRLAAARAAKVAEEQRLAAARAAKVAEEQKAAAAKQNPINYNIPKNFSFKGMPNFRGIASYGGMK
jgi:hypothetical protein